jgi:hypothetical protein
MEGKMHAVTLKIDDSIYSNFLKFLEILPKEKAEIIDDTPYYEPNDETMEAMKDIENGKNLTTHKSVDEMFKALSIKNV